MTETSSPLRISIWKSFIPRRTVIALDKQNNSLQVVDGDNLQEEVYSWYTLESPFDGIADGEVRRKLREKLVERLNTSRPPSERSIDVLKEFIFDAEEAIIESDKVEWTSSQSGIGDDEDYADRINSLLAIILHLKWLTECYADCPNISVSVR